MALVAPDGTSRHDSDGVASAPHGSERTDPSMPNAHFVPHLLRRATRLDPEVDRPRPAKTISRIEVAVVAPAVADPAVLVRLHDDLRWQYPCGRCIG